MKDHKYRIAQVTLDIEDYLWNAPYAHCAEKNDAASIEWLKSSYMATARPVRCQAPVWPRYQARLARPHRRLRDSMLSQLLNSLKRQGFQFITLLEAEKDRAYQSDPDLALKDGGTFLDQMLEAKHIINLPPHAEKPYDQLDALCR